MKLNSTLIHSVLADVDLSSADGRAGIGCLLRELERISPDAILTSAARIEGDRLGLSKPPRRT